MLTRLHHLSSGLVIVLVGAIGCASPPTEPDNAANNEAGAALRQDVRPNPTGGQPELTPAERRLRKESQAFERTVWEGTLTGATAGSILGGWLVGGIRGAVTAGTAGGASGSLAGAYVARKQRSFASAEDQLEAMVADVKSSNQAVESLIASAREVIAQNRRLIAAAEQRYRAGQAAEAEVAATRRRVAANASVVRNAAQGASDQYEMFSGAERIYRTRDESADTRDLRRELDAFREQIDTLEGLVGVIDTA